MMLRWAKVACGVALVSLVDPSEAFHGLSAARLHTAHQTRKSLTFLCNLCVSCHRSGRGSPGAISFLQPQCWSASGGGSDNAWRAPWFWVTLFPRLCRIGNRSKPRAGASDCQAQCAERPQVDDERRTVAVAQTGGANCC